MELKEFVKKVIVDLDEAISEANAETRREIRFKGVKEQRTALEFDVAVTVESSNETTGGGAIKVWGIGEIGVGGGTELKNSTVSRVRFGVDIAEETRSEVQQRNNRNAPIQRDMLNPAR
ncbi:MAG: hypothetical protein A3A81_07975 [Omnitrophica bacterium RIFCSPLOWO2_01_FULL_45_10b]|nr:MAG: hypothetical protein A3A81_07975 [Omnitrophica bacterium RIFCSPLOWO2_01_FULL_45_10b]